MNEVLKRRAATKNEMINERGGFFRCQCDLCEIKYLAKNLEMHELVNRARTVNNELAREASFSKYICSILCRTCHEKAHNPVIRTLLLQRNCERYGRIYVLRAIDQVENYMRTKLGIEI